jgi:transmembrane 9 superfamily protein 2/4
MEIVRIYAFYFILCLKYELYRVHGDVFRPPQKGMLLSVLIGNGVQIAIMSLITLSKIIYSIRNYRLCFYLVFACLGFLSPASRGALMTCMSYIIRFFFIRFIIYLYRCHRLLCSFGYTSWLYISSVI